MSHSLSDRETARLQILADAIRDKIDEDGYNVSKAVALDPAFSRSGRPSGELGRHQVLEAIAGAAGVADVTFKDHGSWGDVLSLDDGVLRHYRVKTATLNADGTPRVLVGRDSGIMNVESGEFLNDERWILGFVLEGRDQVRVFIARAYKIDDTYGVPEISLGPAMFLIAGEPTTPPAGFVSSDEDSLPGMDEQADDTGTGTN